MWDEFQDKFNIPVVVELGDLGDRQSWPGEGARGIQVLIVDVLSIG